MLFYLGDIMTEVGINHPLNSDLLSAQISSVECAIKRQLTVVKGESGNNDKIVFAIHVYNNILNLKAIIEDSRLCTRDPEERIHNFKNLTEKEKTTEIEKIRDCMKAWSRVKYYEASLTESCDENANKIIKLLNPFYLKWNREFSGLLIKMINEQIDIGHVEKMIAQYREELNLLANENRGLLSKEAMIQIMEDKLPELEAIEILKKMMSEKFHPKENWLLQKIILIENPKKIHKLLEKEVFHCVKSQGQELLYVGAGGPINLKIVISLVLSKVHKLENSLGLKFTPFRLYITDLFHKIIDVAGDSSPISEPLPNYPLPAPPAPFPIILAAPTIVN